MRREEANPRGGEARARPSRPLPREHGAWALLYGPLTAGLLAAWRFGLAELLLMLSATALFLAREPVARLVRGNRHGLRPDLERYYRWWAAGLGALGLATAAVLMSVLGRPGLGVLGLAVLPAFLIHLVFTERREERSVAAEVLGVLALNATAPAAWYTATGSWGRPALVLWVLSVLYFASAIFLVKMLVSRFAKPAGFAAARRRNLTYHILVIGLLAGLTGFGWVSFWVLPGFLPILARAFWGAWRGPAKLNLKRVGYLEVAYTVWFVLWTGFGWGR